MFDLFGNPIRKKVKKEIKENPLIKEFGKYYPIKKCGGCVYYANRKCLKSKKEHSSQWEACNKFEKI